MADDAEQLTAADRERFYDEELAPVLADMAKRCAEKGLSFVALVEWDFGEVGHTGSLREGRGPQIENASAAAFAGDNVDALIMHLMRKATEHGHSSMFLHQLGVPTTPEAGKPH